MTFIIVTHDLSVARATSRILSMEDGKVVSDDVVGSPLEEDLKVWAHSELGQRIVSTAPVELDSVGIFDNQMENIRSLLKHNRETP